MSGARTSHPDCTACPSSLESSQGEALRTLVRMRCHGVPGPTLCPESSWDVRGDICQRRRRTSRYWHREQGFRCMAYCEGRATWKEKSVGTHLKIVRNWFEIKLTCITSASWKARSSSMPTGHPTDHRKFKRTVAGKDIIDCGLFCSAVRMTRTSWRVTISLSYRVH